MHPRDKIRKAIEKLKETKVLLDIELAEVPKQVTSVEKEYSDILGQLINMMETAANSHWFRTGESQFSPDRWDTRDKWKRAALEIADTLVEDEG